MVWYSHLLKNFPQFIVIHIVKVFGVVNKAEVDVFLELSCFFYDPTDVGNLISGSSAFPKSSLYIWIFLVHVLLKPVLKDFEHYLASMRLYSSLNIFGIAHIWDWKKKNTLIFPSPMATAEFSKFAGILSAAL